MEDLYTLLVGSGIKCSGSLWNHLCLMHGFCTSACIMQLAGMELAYTHIKFHITIILAMIAEWEDVGFCVLKLNIIF